MPAGGEPGLLNLASGELTPAFALFVVMPTPPLGLLAAVLFNLSFCATGLYAFVRRHGGRLPAAFAGLTIMLCGFNAAWLYWPHVSTAIWFGWLLWALDRARYPCARHTVVGIVGPLVGLLLGGFPFVTFLGLGTALLYMLCATVLYPVTAQGLPWLRSALALAAAIGIASPGLVGFAEWISDFHLGMRITGSILSPKDMAQLLPRSARDHRGVEADMYVGVIGALLAVVAACLALLSLARRRRPPLLAAFALILLAIAGGLVFDLLPRGFLGWLPGLKNNQWNRAICVLDLAVALAAASCMQQLRRRTRAMVFFSVALGFLVIQTLDQATYFKRLNGPVPAAYYYPRLDLIDQIVSTKKPFQSALADDSFLVSGTLGAYGVPEWFGHGFRTELLKDRLRAMTPSAMTTATASRVGAADFHLDSALFSAMGIRYVLGNEAVLSSIVGLPAGAEGSPHQPMPAMPATTLSQRVTLGSQVTIEGVSCNMATYGRQGQRGTLEVTLAESGSPVRLAGWSVPAADIRDNEVHTFAMPSPTRLGPGDYVVELSYTGAGPGDLLTVWSFRGAWPGCSASAGEKVQPACMDFGFRVRRADLGQFVPVASHGGIRLIENEDVPAGPYFLRNLSVEPHRPDGAPIALSYKSTSRFKLRYLAAQPGFVVVPMSWRSGWRVEVNGVPTDPEMYLGVMPAVPVDGPAELTFRYWPMALELGLPVSVATLIALRLTGVIWPRWNRPSVARLAALSGGSARRASD